MAVSRWRRDSPFCGQRKNRRILGRAVLRDVGTTFLACGSAQRERCPALRCSPLADDALALRSLPPGARPLLSLDLRQLPGDRTAIRPCANTAYPGKRSDGPPWAGSRRGYLQLRGPSPLHRTSPEITLDRPRPCHCVARLRRSSRLAHTRPRGIVEICALLK